MAGKKHRVFESIGFLRLSIKFSLKVVWVFSKTWEIIIERIMRGKLYIE